MKLDVQTLRYLSNEEWRTLTAVEMGQKNHELVPTPLIEKIARLRHGGTRKAISCLLKHKLVHHEAQDYEGYRLTYLGYDFLALRTFLKQGLVASVGRQIGVGKESDLYEVADCDGTVLALKLHRLGRTSFRAVKSKRDYLRKGHHYSWLYLSRLAAIKEHAFMVALGSRGVPVPIAVGQNRHAVLMELVNGVQLSQVRELEEPAGVCTAAVAALESIARLGLVHCDFNEFNLLLCHDRRLVVIDFPQMVSAAHANAEALYERDRSGVLRFFERKLGYSPAEGTLAPWAELQAAAYAGGNASLDRELTASGWLNEPVGRVASASSARPPALPGPECSEWAREGPGCEAGCSTEASQTPRVSEGGSMSSRSSVRDVPDAVAVPVAERPPAGDCPEDDLCCRCSSATRAPGQSVPEGHTYAQVARPHEACTSASGGLGELVQVRQGGQVEAQEGGASDDSSRGSVQHRSGGRVGPQRAALTATVAAAVREQARARAHKGMESGQQRSKKGSRRAGKFRSRESAAR